MTRSELLKTAKPILFNTEMVRAILNGRKTVTRRCVKPKSRNAYGFFVLTNKSDGSFAGVYDYDEDEDAFDKPQRQPAYKGDILYVREAFAPVIDYIDGEPETVFAYKASTPNNQYVGNVMSLPITAWHPSIHMPKEAARIFLRVTDVRVENLNDISFNDILTAEEIYELARKRQPAPDNMTLPEQLLYTTARNIYKSYSDGIISLEQAKSEKQKSIRDFENLSRKYEIYDDHARRRVKISQLLTEADKNGCEICKRVSRVFDGREVVPNEQH